MVSSGRSPRTLFIIWKNLLLSSFDEETASLPTLSNNAKFSEAMKLFMNSSEASPRRLFTMLKNVTNSSCYDTVLANFSQFPPLSATQDLCQAKYNLFLQLFCLHNMNVVHCGQFHNILFWLCFCNPRLHQMLLEVFIFFDQ